MPKPSIIEIENLGGFVLPFERQNFQRKIGKGENIFEDFKTAISNISNGKLPNQIIKTSTSTILDEQPFESKYLWVIDAEGLKIILENTPNPKAEREIICHTNITGGKKALQGGELWFGTDNKIYLNNKSGRYGATTLNQRNAVLDYFQSIGFEVIQIL